MNIKQANTDSKVENLTSHIHSHKEKINLLSEDLIEFSAKLLVIEEDLSDLKEASEDILQLKHIQESLSDYAASLKIDENVLYSGSKQIRDGTFVIIYTLLYFCYIILLNIHK